MAVMEHSDRQNIKDRIAAGEFKTRAEIAYVLEGMCRFDHETLVQQALTDYAGNLCREIMGPDGKRRFVILHGSGTLVDTMTCTDIRLLKMAKEQLEKTRLGIAETGEKIAALEAEIAGQISMFDEQAEAR